MHFLFTMTMHRRNNRVRFGFSRLDVLAVIVIAVVIVAVVLPLIAFGMRGGGAWPSAAKQNRDADQLRAIYDAWMLHAEDHNDRFPIPGLLHRRAGAGMPDPPPPGMGIEAVSRNTTANLYSMCIGQQYFGPEKVVSPWERNPNVTVKEDYDFDAYAPEQGSYWDTTFNADLERGSNASYAHPPIHGAWKRLHWRAMVGDDVVCLGTRGPQGGRHDPDSLTCDDEGNWKGHVVYGDGSVRWLVSMSDDDDFIGDEIRRQRRNLFDVEDHLGSLDPILTFTLRFDEMDRPVIQHD